MRVCLCVVFFSTAGFGSFVCGAFGDRCIKPHHGGDGFFYLGLLIDPDGMIGAHRAPRGSVSVHITVNRQQMLQDRCTA